MAAGLIIAIDGPSGAGKSTLSRLIAKRLGYVNIDTGAMYRCVALAAHRAGIDPEDGDSVGQLARSLTIRFRQGDGGERVMLDGDDVTGAIRTPEVSLLTARVAAIPAVREAMVALQRGMGESGGVVLEGRDIGSVVFPRAEVKFYLVASAAERGRRRFAELQAQGTCVDLQQTIAEVEQRDAADTLRSHSPLVKTEDAVTIDSDGKGIEEVLEEMLAIIADRRRLAGEDR